MQRSKEVQDIRYGERIREACGMKEGEEKDQ